MLDVSNLKVSKCYWTTVVPKTFSFSKTFASGTTKFMFFREFFRDKDTPAISMQKNAIGFIQRRSTFNLCEILEILCFRESK